MIPLTVTQIDRLLVLLQAQSEPTQDDLVLITTLTLCRTRQFSRAAQNVRDEHGKEIPIDGKRRGA